MTTYKVVRKFFDRNLRNQNITLRTGLTEAEAQAHCQDPETSSSTCTSAAGRRRTRRLGPWFDLYTAER
jgi:hypothetical protein